MQGARQSSSAKRGGKGGGKKEEGSAGRTRRERGLRRRKRTWGIGRDVRRKAARRRGDDEAEAPDKREVMRSMRRKRKRTSGMRERERERGGKERGKAARSQGGLFGDRRRWRAKNEQDGSEGTRLELCLCLTLPYPPCPLLSSSLSLLRFASSRLASPRLCLPARHETANTPELKLRSHANAAARLRLLGRRLSFYPR